MSPKFKYLLNQLEQGIIQRLQEGNEEVSIDVFRIMEATGYSYTPAYSLLRMLEVRLEAKGYTVFRKGGTLWVEK